MIRRRNFLALIAGAAIAWPLTARAQQSAKTARVAMVCGTRCDTPSVDAFWATLRDLGWIDGQNLVRDMRGAGGEPGRLPSIAAEILATRPDVIITFAPQPTRAVKTATSTVPIVMAFVADPVLIGLVPNLARPGGNLTGVTTLPGRGFVAKQIELLTELLPGTQRVAVFWNSTNEIHRATLPEELLIAQRLGVQFHMIDVRGPGEIEPAFEAAAKGAAEAALAAGDPLFHNPPRRFPDLALQYRLPTMFLIGNVARAGGLISYGPEFISMTRRAAVQADRILRGANPGDIPIEQPTRFELVINLATAKALGLTIPRSILARADEVIE